MRKIYLLIFLLCTTTLSILAQPLVSAPTPSQSPADVISVYCDIAAYNSLASTDFNPNWGQQGFNNTSEIAIGGSSTFSQGSRSQKEIFSSCRLRSEERRVGKEC